MIPVRQILSACCAIAAALPAASQSNDPFALLFGDEDAPRTSISDEAGSDDLTIVSLNIRGLDVASALPAYTSQAGLCIVLTDFLDALEFPVSETSDGKFEGWAISKARTVELDLNTGLATISGTAKALQQPDYSKTPQGWCVNITALASLFPLEVTYNARDLAVTIAPEEVLPLEARLEREAARRFLSRNGAASDPDYPELANPYRWLSWPVADISVDVSQADSSSQRTTLSFEAAGDVLKATGRLRTVGGTNRAFTDGLRFTLSRSNSAAVELGPLRARHFSIGDVASPALNLVTRARTGLGFTVTNAPEFTTNLFDTTQIRGALPQGWEAELYDGEQLIAFITEADTNGDYVFSDVRLTPGFNRFEVRLFGPFGETETRIFKQFVGSDLTPENEVTYAFGLVEGDRGLFGRPERLQNASIGSPETTGTLAYLSLSRGFSQRLTARFDGQLGLDEAGREDSTAAFSLSGSYLGGYGTFGIALDGSGRPAIRTSVQRRLGSQASFSASFTDFGSLQNALTGRDANRIDKTARLRLNTVMPFLARPVPLQSEIEWTQFGEELSRLDATVRTSSHLSGIRWTNTVFLAHLRNRNTAETDIRGELLFGKSLRSFRLRGALGYRLDEGISASFASAAAQRQIGRNGFAQLTISQDFQNQQASAAASWSHRFRAFTFSTNAGISSSGNWTAGVRLSVALSRDTETGRPNLSPPGLTRSGTLRPIVFEDTNANGRIDLGEPRIKGAQFIVANALRPEATDLHGRSIIGELPIGTDISAELKLSSLDDPFLLPANIGVRATVRPGQALDLPVPLLATGDIEGTLTVITGDKTLPVAGVTVQFLDPENHILKEVRTEFDGYFYTDGLVLGPVTVRVRPEEVESVGGTSESVLATMTADQPSVFGIALAIHKK